MITIDTRHKGDGLVNDDKEWTHAQTLILDGESKGDVVGLSWYKYGAQIFVNHPSCQLEVHGWRGAGYSACCTFQAFRDRNTFQIRETYDRNSIELRFPTQGTGDPSIGTEVPNTNLCLNPKGDLILSPTGSVKIGNETLEQFIKRVTS